ncbi:pogo transposable element with KRAB domain-like [Brachionus plicatilis]|uniref:Pogo transposable element with KRAB domain-like n=1 Tax=Brachionus plicatilis TaxID=10195 RepID=A0A3M7RQY8_BRAPC|nr:pogo transposable element with KRAB domain-like [Brachionus plicatilis]
MDSVNRRSYTIGFKRVAIQHYDKTNNKSKTSRNLRVPRPVLIKWIQNREKIFERKLKVNSKRVVDASKQRKPEFSENEDRLFAWFSAKRKEQFKSESNEEIKFKASIGWLRRFMKRKELVLRRISDSGRGIPNDCQNIVQEYIMNVNRIIADNNLQPYEIFNFDESSFYMCSPGNFTIDYKGAKKFYSKSCGKEKVRLSCLMCSSADGIKLPILCVVPRNIQIPNLKLNENMLFIYETKGTFNSVNLKEHYVQRILRPHLLKNQIKKSLIILDRAKCHTQESFKDSLASCGCKLAFIPLSLTNILQPADVCWFKFLKNKYSLHWNNWFLYGQKLLTKYGNIAGPGYKNITDWILDGWLELNPEYISKSFKDCGIGTLNPSDFNSELRKIYQDGIIPPNISVDIRNEIDDFNEVYDSYNTDDEDSISDQEINDYCDSSNYDGKYEDEEDFNESWYVNLEEDYFEEESNDEEIPVYSESETDSDTERDSDENEENKNNLKISSKRKKNKTGFTKNLGKIPKLNAKEGLLSEMQECSKSAKNPATKTSIGSKSQAQSKSSYVSKSSASPQPISNSSSTYSKALLTSKLPVIPSRTLNSPNTLVNQQACALIVID